MEQILKTFKKNKNQVILFVVVSTLVISCGFFLYSLLNNRDVFVQKSMDELDTISTSEQTLYWMDAIESVGGKDAYRQFSQLYRLNTYEQQHTKAHIFGEALFKALGIDGVAVCDSNFGFGCYHSFFGWALLTHGTDVINDLDKACIAVFGEKGLGCQHGIGHGILTELGAEEQDQSLSLCATLNWQGPIGGCTSGVFMEYNFNTMGDNSVRALTDKGYHHPCVVVDEKFKEACYFEQPMWWSALLNGDYTAVGKLCSEALSQRENQACYRGVGNLVAGSREYEVEGMLEACSLMPNEEGRLLCIEGATWLMSAQPEFKDLWQQMCAELKGESKNRCLESNNFI